MKRLAVISVALLSWAEWGLAHEISGDLIKSIQYGVSQSGQAEVFIQFTIPTQIVGDSKADNANRADLRVQFHLTEDEAKLLPLEEIKVADSDPQIPLHSVTFDGFNVSEHVFQLQFKKQVLYKITQSGTDGIKILFPEVVMDEAPINKVDAAEIARLKAELARRQAKKTAIPAPVVTAPPSVATRPKTATPTDTPRDTASPKTSAASLDELLAQGQTALDGGKYREAIALFNKVLNKGNPEYMGPALEKLGDARAKNGQTGMARRIYEQYLKQYAKTADDKERVKASLASIQPTISRDRKKRRRPVIVGTKKDLFGSISLFSFKGEHDIEEGNTSEINSIRSFVNLNGRVRTNRYDIRTAFYGTATQHNDLVQSTTSSKKEQEWVANQVYVDYRDEVWGFDSKFGRQSGNKVGAGIFGRFDGVAAGYQMTPGIKFTTAYGYTVDYTAKDKIQTNLPFTTFSVKLGPYKEYLQIAPYFFDQKVDGVTNRTAIGLETRWTNPRLEMFNLVDYETNFAKVNFALFNTIFRLSEKTRINLNYDTRHNPNLETRSALNRSNDLYTVCTGSTDPGSYSSIAEAINNCTEDQIRDFIADRVGHSELLTFSINRNFSRTNQMSFDVSALKYEYKNLFREEEDEGIIRFVEEKEDADQNSVGLQWMLSDVLAKRDSNIYSLRLVDDKAYSATRFNFSYRFSYGRSLRFIFNYNGELRDNVPTVSNSLGSSLVRHRPSVKFDYKIGKSFQLQFDFIYDMNRYSVPADAPIEERKPNDSNMYLMTLGVRQIF